MLTLSRLFSCALIYFIASTPFSDGLRILGIFPFHLASHNIMCQELCRGLATKGHQVDVYSHFPLQRPIKNYQDFCLRGTLPALSNNVSYEEVANPDPVYKIKTWIEINQEGMCGLMEHPFLQKLLNDPPKDPPYDIFITELSIVHCYIPFGRHLNVPVIAIITTSLLDWHCGGFDNPLNLATDSTTFSTYVAPMTFFERLGNLMIHTKMVQGFIQSTGPQNQYVEKYFGPGLPNVYDLQKDVSLVLVNHDVSLSGMMPFAPKVIPVGGLHVVDHNDTLPKVVQQWLDDSKDGCIYMSFGSFIRIETLPKRVIDAFYKSFKKIAPVRVLLKIAKPEELPSELPSNVLTQKWFQQIAVLKHPNIKAYVSHGGLMGGQEAVYYGVPMIIVPLFSDQFFNAKAYAQRNIAVHIDLHDISESTFTNALIAILKDSNYRNAVQKLSKKMKDRPVSVMDTAIFWVEYIHRHGKKALRSASEDLLWWQKSLLDIYAFLGGVVIIILFVMISVLKLFLYIGFQIFCKSTDKLKGN